MARMDMVGDQMSMQGGYDEMLDSFPGGTIQLVGDKMDLSKTNRPVGQFTDQPMGAVDMTGDKMPLSRKPNRGYGSGTLPNDDTPMNKQASVPDTTETY